VQRNRIKRNTDYLGRRMDGRTKSGVLIKDNVGFGEWDWDSLANEWDTEKLDEWGLDLPIDLSVVDELEAEEDNYEIPERNKHGHSIRRLIRDRRTPFTLWRFNG
jgi:hypothetical protein